MIFFHPKRDNAVISHQNQHHHHQQQHHHTQQPKHSNGKILINHNKPGTARNSKGQSGDICPNCNQDILLADTYLVNNCPVCCISWPCICVPLSCWLFITCSKRKCGSCGAEFSLCC